MIGRMVPVAADDLRPFVDHRQIDGRILVVQAPVGELAPDHVSQLVGPIEEPRLENLLVQPGPVEAHGLRELDVVAQRLVARRGPDAFRIEALIEDQSVGTRACR